MKKKIISAVIVAVAAIFCVSDALLTAGTDAGGDDTAALMEKAENTPFGRYPETITYTLGKLSGANN